jgi:hypothetical protein
MGLLFESLGVRDLLVLAQPVEGQVRHYRDNKGLEVDAIVTCDDGRWGAFEIKLGCTGIDAVAKNLLALAAKIDTVTVASPVSWPVSTAPAWPTDARTAYASSPSTPCVRDEGKRLCALFPRGPGVP